jgi:hypothetical protein
MAHNNLLTQLTASIPENDSSGIVVRRQVTLAALNLATNVAIAADETNAIAAIVQETNDIVFLQDFIIPIDYDVVSDHLKVRVLVSMLTVSTDTDVEVDMEVYKKTAGSALGSDLDPTAPGTILSTTEQWIEFDLSGNSWDVEDIAFIRLITNGGNDTNAEEVALHAVEIEYKSLVVASILTDRA